MSYRFRQHVAAALDKLPGVLYDWMRDVYRRNHDVLCYTLQEDIPPMDLDLFEGYWINQFSGLLNTAGNKSNAHDSDVAKRIKAHLQSELEQARAKPQLAAEPDPPRRS